MRFSDKNNAFLFIILLLTFSVHAQKNSRIPSHPSGLKYDSLGWSIPSGEPYRLQMENGMIVYIAEDSLLPLVQISGFVRYGSLNDPAGKEGLSSLLATLMRSGGTKKYPADTLVELIDLMAMKFNLSAGETQFTFSASFLSEYTKEALDILEQILFHPAFDEKKLEKERKIFLEAILHRFDNPAPTLNAAYKKVMYPGEESSRMATAKSIKSITRDDLVMLHKKIIFPANIIFSAAGSLKKDTLIKNLESAFPRSTKKNESGFPTVEVKPSIKCLLVNKKISQAYVRLALPLFKRPHPDYYAVSVMNMILGGGGFTSRLGTKIRSDAGLTYSIYSHAESNYNYPGTFLIDFYTKNSSFAQAVALTIDEVRKIAENGVTEEEITNAKSSLIGELPSMFRSPFDIVSTYAWNEYYGRQPDHYKVYAEKISKLTRDDILRVAKQYLVPENLTFVVVGDIDALMKVKDDQFSLSGMKSKTIPADSIPALP